MTHRTLLLFASLLLLLPSVLPAEKPATPDKNWTHWRGPTYDGYSTDTQVPLTWSEKENLLWKVELPGMGKSSPIVWGNHVFLTASSKDGQERFLICAGIKEAKVLWQKMVSQGVPPGRTHDWNGYASASCTTDGEFVYAFFGTPGLFCYDFAGNQIWKHEFGVFTNRNGWGTAASPFLFEDLVIQNCDNDGVAGLPSGAKGEKAAPASLVAFDKKKGAVRWETPRNMGHGYSTPRLLTRADGRQELLLNSPQGVWSYDPRSGKEIWHCDRKGDLARFGEPIPVTDGETLFVSSGRPGPLQAIKLADAKGDVSKSHLLWEVERKGRNVASTILWHDLLYAADIKGQLTCYDGKSGNVIYNERLGNGKNKPLASPVAVRGKLLFLLDDGTTTVLEPGREFKVLHRNVLGNGGNLDFGASPALSDGKLFLRSQSYLYCIGEK